MLVCAGGATGAHITALARQMGIKKVLVPKLASGLCAFGQIISNVKYNYMATCPARLDNDAAYRRIDELFHALEAEGVRHLQADGFTKSKTIIGKGAFVGTNTSLVAPVTIGAGAYIGSGSVITRDVPDDAMALERSAQSIREGGAIRYRESKTKDKTKKSKS